MFAVSRIFKYAGVRAALFILPGLAMASYSMLLWLPLLPVIRWVKIMENGADYSIQNTTMHALFLPTSREAKYKAKAAIDMFFKRAGDVLEAGIVKAGSAFFAGDQGVRDHQSVVDAGLAGHCRNRPRSTAGTRTRRVRRAPRNPWSRVAP